MSNRDSPISNPNTTIVLCNVWRREKTRQCQGSGMEAALLRRGEQALDKEMDIKDARSDTHVLNSGPTQAQPIRGVL